MSNEINNDISKGHYVNDAPFDPKAIETLTPEQEAIYLAPQRKLIWWKFKKHKLAVASGIFLLLMYFMTLFAEFLAPYSVETRNSEYILAPPHDIHFFHEGEFIGPFVYDYDKELDLEKMMRVYTPNTERIIKLRFFCSGDPYKFWGLIEADNHLMCADIDEPVYLLGSDTLGRDMLSRIVYGARISLTIGLVGIAISFALGITIGGLAGYYGGWVDTIAQRIIEVVQSLPTLPLWLTLVAIMPANWSQIAVYFAITIILGLIDWTGLARAVRSKLLSLREEDYVLAARLMGASPKRIIALHLVPGFMSHLIASATITIPTMILGETALSFLGLGLRPPTVSWGILLNDAQNIGVVALTPWLIYPVIPVIFVILAFNFFGDGLRDAADPYG